PSPGGLPAPPREASLSSEACRWPSPSPPALAPPASCTSSPRRTVLTSTSRTSGFSRSPDSTWSTCTFRFPDGPRVPARARRHQAAVARSCGKPRRQYVALLAPCRRPPPFPGFPRLGPAALRECVLRLRDRQRTDQPGTACVGAADRGRAQQRGRRLRAWLREGDRDRDDHHRHVGDRPVHAPAAEDRAMAVAARSIQRTRWIKLQVFRYVVFLLAAIFFLVPLGAMVEF